MAELTIHVSLRTYGFAKVDCGANLAETRLANQYRHRISGVKTSVAVGRMVCGNCNDRTCVQQWPQRLIQSLQKVSLGQRLSVVRADIRCLDMHKDHIMGPKRYTRRYDLGIQISFHSGCKTRVCDRIKTKDTTDTKHRVATRHNGCLYTEGLQRIVQAKMRACASSNNPTSTRFAVAAPGDINWMIDQSPVCFIDKPVDFIRC